MTKGPVPHTIPPYIPSKVQDDSDMEPVENLTEGEKYELIQEYLRTADEETMNIVLGILRGRKWGD